MRLLLISFFILIMTGCGTVVSTPQVVKVPIATKCSPTIKVTPIGELPFNKAKKNMSAYDKIRLLLAENMLITGQNKELKAALSECTK